MFSNLTLAFLLFLFALTSCGSLTSTDSSEIAASYPYATCQTTGFLSKKWDCLGAHNGLTYRRNLQSWDCIGGKTVVLYSGSTAQNFTVFACRK